MSDIPPTGRPDCETRSSRRGLLFATAGTVLGLSVSGLPSRSAGGQPERQGNEEATAPNRELPVLATADVLVCGGGTAGISAAYCAARHGAKVVLLERWPSLGGMATNALVNIWHTSDRTKQVIYGFVQEAIQRAGPLVRRLSDFPKHFETHDFDSEGMRVVFHKMLSDAGVRIICNLKAVESLIQKNRIRGVLVDSKRGRRAVLGRIVIDATGDGDVAANAKLPFDYGRPGDGRVQGMTMMFCLRNVNSEAVRERRRRWRSGCSSRCEHCATRGSFRSSTKRPRRTTSAPGRTTSPTTCARRPEIPWTKRN